MVAKHMNKMLPVIGRHSLHASPILYSSVLLHTLPVVAIQGGAGILKDVSPGCFRLGFIQLEEFFETAVLDGLVAFNGRT